MTVQITTLDNGLRVTTDPMDGVESVSLGVWIGVGTRNELEEHNGVAHLVEHMLFKGTERRSAFDFKITVSVAERQSARQVAIRAGRMRNHGFNRRHVRIESHIDQRQINFCAGIVVAHDLDARRGAERRADRAAERDLEGLVALGHGVGDRRDVDGRLDRARGDRDGARRDLHVGRVRRHGVT